MINWLRYPVPDIEPWTFEQHLGEAVIIPAGCPYQIRKLKVMREPLVSTPYFFFWYVYICMCAELCELMESTQSFSTESTNWLTQTAYTHTHACIFLWECPIYCMKVHVCFRVA